MLAVNSNDPDRYPADSFEAMTERVEREGGWSHPYLHDAKPDRRPRLRRAHHA